MRDLQLNFFFNLGGHLAILRQIRRLNNSWLYLSRAKRALEIEKEHCGRVLGSAQLALSEVEWASRVLTPVRLGLSASRRNDLPKKLFYLLESKSSQPANALGVASTRDGRAPQIKDIAPPKR